MVKQHIAGKILAVQRMTSLLKILFHSLETPFLIGSLLDLYGFVVFIFFSLMSQMAKICLSRRLTDLRASSRVYLRSSSNTGLSFGLLE